MLLKPSFFIIGERKCGTSSLYRYLLAHPNVLPCKQKEPQFFTKHPLQIWWRINQYYTLFPKVEANSKVTMHWPELDENGKLYEELLEFKIEPDQVYITGEASANTFYAGHPRVIKHFLPDIKLILMLRNPVDRAFSHYRMLERFQREGRNVGTLSGFSLDMYREMEMVQKGKKGRIISPGLYIQRLPKWINTFGRDKIFILKMEDLNKPKKARKVMQELCTFLELPSWDFSTILQAKYNQAPQKQIPGEIWEALHFFYQPYNLMLEDLLGRKLWRSV